MSDNETLILIVFLFCFCLMLVFLCKIFKDLITGIFNFNYGELKSNLQDSPQYVFTERLSGINFLVCHGFWVTVELYSNFIIFKIFNRALVVNDFTNLKLTSKFTSQLVISSGNYKLDISLGKEEYEIMKEFLEGKNV